MNNTIVDYATGKELRDNPEEEYRQLFEHILIDDLGYPKPDIDIEVILQRGSKRDAEKVDVVVYRSADHEQQNAYIIVEIETPKKKYDLQAFSYVSATLAPYCVWFAGYKENGPEPVYLYRDLTKSPTKLIEVPTLPRYGETQETIGLYRKTQLKPAKALKLLFTRIHYHLYGSGPIKREEDVAQEVIKLLFCKIVDEVSPDDLCEFRATPTELETDGGQVKIKKRIEALYERVLSDPDLGTLFRDETLAYDAKWISYIVSELQGIGLMHPDTKTDALGDAYEVFLPATLKGEKGQFFTPREIVRFAVNMIAPSYTKREIMLDPACGSGGFLSIGIEYLRKEIQDLYEPRGYSKDKIVGLLKDYAGKYIFGTDIDLLLYRIAKSYMAIIGDGKSNIYNFDSLEPWDGFPDGFKRRVKFNAVDIITTNPPFGTKIDDTRKEVLKQYDLGHHLAGGVSTGELLDGQDPDKLFLERDPQYLRNATSTQDGGRMMIVLPRQNLSGAETISVELRKWLLKHAKILAVIDLPREAFQPHTGTKTSLVFLQKVANPDNNYPIFMAVSEAVGHDRRGNALFRRDEQGNLVLDEKGEAVIWNDLPLVLDQWQNFVAARQVENGIPSCFTVEANVVRADSMCRIDAWYWDPNKNELAKKLENAVGGEITEIVSLGDLVVHHHGIFYPGRHKRDYVEESENSVPFYSGSQILQLRPFDIKYQPKDYKPARDHFVHKDWILITRSGSTGRVTMVDDIMDGRMVSEHVIRVVCDEELVDPYYVYAYLASEHVGKILLEKGIYASVVDHISPEFVSTIPIPRLKPETEKQIADQVREAERKRSEANATFQANMDAIEDTVWKSIGTNKID